MALSVMQYILSNIRDYICGPGHIRPNSTFAHTLFFFTRKNLKREVTSFTVGIRRNRSIETNPIVSQSLLFLIEYVSIRNIHENDFHAANDQ